MAYEDELRSPKWHYVRERILERDGYRCTQCNTDRQLQVHHKYYIHGRPAWDYEYSALITLCDRCHRVEHNKGNSLDSLDIALQRLVLVAGYGVREWCQNQYPKEDGETIH